MVFKKLLAITENFKKEAKTYQLVLKHPRTPRLAKWLLALALAYALSPFDLIPDFIPVLGYIDDVIIVPVLIILAYRTIPKEIIQECRQQASKL